MLRIERLMMRTEKMDSLVLMNVDSLINDGLDLLTTRVRQHLRRVSAEKRAEDEQLCEPEGRSKSLRSEAVLLETG